MNRHTRPTLAMLMLLVLTLPLVAQAEWVQKEIGYQLSGVTADGSAIYVRDTLKAMLGGGTTTLDTLGDFTLTEAQPLPRGSLGPGVSNTINNSSVNDTTIIGYLVFQADSSGTPTTSLSTMTLIVEGRAGGLGTTTTLARGWVKCDSIVVNGSAGNVSMETIVAPLRTIATITGQNTLNNVAAFAQLRVRVLTATGVLSSARAFLRYWRPTLAYSTSH